MPACWWNMYVCIFIRLCLCFSCWACLYVNTHSSPSHVTLYMCTCVCVRSRCDDNPCAFASQLQSRSLKRDSPWCRYPYRGNLNQADTLLAHPAPAPNCSWQYQMHPIGCSTVVQFSWPLLLVQSPGQRDKLYWKETRIILEMGLVQTVIISLFSHVKNEIREIAVWQKWSQSLKGIRARRSVRQMVAGEKQHLIFKKAHSLGLKKGKPSTFHPYTLEEMVV